ncbi:hypothetical protein [Marinomonas epiphytica]
MKPTHFIALFALSITAPAFAAPLQAVIGLNSSTIFEQTVSQTGPQLKPIPASLASLSAQHTAISLPQDTPYRPWLEALLQKVKVDHKQGDISYLGKLIHVDNQLAQFSLQTELGTMQLPIADFYLLPLEGSQNKHQSSSYGHFPEQVYYQTNQLSWSPQLRLIIQEDTVTIYQNALLHNNSDKNIMIDQGILHLSHDNPIRPVSRKLALESAADMSPIQYSNNEISYSLETSKLTLAAFSDLVYPLRTSQNPITDRQHRARLPAYGQRGYKQPIPFNSYLTVSLIEDTMPGEYQTFWRRGTLLLPANHNVLSHARQGQSIEIQTAKSQDIKGTLTLVDSSSNRLPSTQTWELELTNLSDQPQHYALTQQTQGVIKQLIAKQEVKKQTANSLNLEGTLKANEVKRVRYKIELEQ